MNEYIAYLHARVSRGEGEGLTLVLDYDAHYCAYFRDHTSQWRLEIPTLKTVERVALDGISGEVAFQDGIAFINVPKGIGRHTITVFQ